MLGQCGNVPLQVDQHDDHKGEEGEDLHRETFSSVVVWLSSETQKRDHILGLLTLRRRSAIFELDALIEQLLGHRDHSTRKVRIVCLSVVDFDSSRGLEISGEQ